MLISKLCVVAMLVAAAPTLLLPKRIGDGLKENLDGEWKIVRLTQRGNEVDPLNMAGITYRIKGDRCDYMSGGMVLNEFRWTRDETLRPFTLDIEYIGDNPATKLTYAGGVKAVYRLVDGKLERNYADPGKPRPTDFKSTIENQHTLILLERAK
jgi:uncharacterized protein (TIGR03067 family)